MYTTFEEEAKRKQVRGRSLSILEYDKILDRLVNHARTIYGRELCYGLIPTSDLPLVESWQKETEDSLEFLVKEGALPLPNTTSTVWIKRSSAFSMARVYLS